jgi:hypothetical protein
MTQEHENHLTLTICTYFFTCFDMIWSELYMLSGIKPTEVHINYNFITNRLEEYLLNCL